MIPTEQQIYNKMAETGKNQSQKSDVNLIEMHKSS